ncbi:MAG: SEC-C metal-binding domain-containing protein [Deltaproteobacteria bacterium]|nr:SEC-C metal-binding domain-containing protein [Deltaproteobacteria bacterium]
MDKKTVFDEKFYRATCVDLCWGKCCNPWWGVIFYTLRKDGGAAGLSSFKKTVMESIIERAERISSAYVTREESGSRRLFGRPERYNVAVKDVRVGSTYGELIIDLVAMYAFRCSFFDDTKQCSIHPTKLGADIRPPHCAELGTPEAKSGEKGFCRVIHAAAIEGEHAVIAAVNLEKKVSKMRYDEGSLSAEDAAVSVIDEIKRISDEKSLLPKAVKKQDTPGRNDPCPCGSGKKYKKCHAS